MKLAGLVVFLALPAVADETRKFSVALSAAWAVPFTRGSDYQRLRQDLTVSFLGQLELGRVLAEAEASFGGLNVSNPRFNLLVGRLGAFVLRGEADVSVSAGAGYMTYKANSPYECFDFGCDKYDGHGLATVAEVAARFAPNLPVRLGLFLQGIVPLFDVEQHAYPGLSRTRAIGVIAIGARLFL